MLMVVALCCYLSSFHRVLRHCLSGSGRSAPPVRAASWQKCPGAGTTMQPELGAKSPTSTNAAEWANGSIVDLPLNKTALLTTVFGSKACQTMDDQSVDQLRPVDPASSHRLRIHTGVREPGHGVQFVHEQFAIVLQKKSTRAIPSYPTARNARAAIERIDASFSTGRSAGTRNSAPSGSTYFASYV